MISERQNVHVGLQTLRASLLKCEVAKEAPQIEKHKQVSKGRGKAASSVVNSDKYESIRNVQKPKMRNLVTSLLYAAFKQDDNWWAFHSITYLRSLLHMRTVYEDVALTVLNK